MTTDTVNIYEDNSGSVYLEKNGQAWALGPVTPDMYGGAGADCAAWVDGDWQPNASDGQTAIESTADLNLIATWSEELLDVVSGQWPEEPLAGGGGRRYLGIE